MSVNKGTDGTFKVGRLTFSKTAVLFLAEPGDPVNGVSGTGAGIAGIGSLYINTTSGSHFRNTNTQASPTWTLSN